MNDVRLPNGLRLKPLEKSDPRRRYRCGQSTVDAWLRSKAFQHQKKRLSTTKVLVNSAGEIGGYYTLATGQVDFGDLPPDIARRLLRRALPIAILAWLGVDHRCQHQGLGDRLLAQALRDCYEAGQTFAFVGVILDCIDDLAKTFYERWDFAELPGHPYRLFLNFAQLQALMKPIAR